MGHMHWFLVMGAFFGVYCSFRRFIITLILQLQKQQQQLQAAAAVFEDLVRKLTMNLFRITFVIAVV